MALEVATHDDLTAQKGLYEGLGYTDCSEIKDRHYFHSIYCRCPGRILVECAANAAGGARGHRAIETHCVDLRGSRSEINVNRI